MRNKQEKAPRMQQIDIKAFDKLFLVLQAEGYEVIGPTVRDAAVVLDRIASFAQLPIGWTDRQSPGTYRLERTHSCALFGYAAGPQSWKKFLHPATRGLWQAQRGGDRFEVVAAENNAPAWAFVGVRPCDLQAILIHDKVFMEGPFIDPLYRARREAAFVVVLNCTQPGGTCFCASMQTGPQAAGPYDLALTEVVEKSRHYFVGEAGSEKGSKVLEQIPHRPADTAEQDAARKRLRQAADHMGRTLDTTRIKELLYRNLEHPRWDDVAARCLACTNCTLVCPTCFCTTLEDMSDISGSRAERSQRWDSCFNLNFSYIHGGYVRQTIKARYRQWMTHKLASWIDQFGVSGCVGCGRCITWCPVGIDITEETKAIRETQR